VNAASRPVSLLSAVRSDVQARLYDFYDELRAADECYWDARLQAWVATSYELVSQAAGDPRLSSVRYPDLAAVPDELRPLARVLDKQMLYSDAPDHPRLRGLVSKAFNARAIERLRERITVTVDRIVATARPTGHMDVIADLAYPLPVTVICDLLDVPPADRDRLKSWSARIAMVNRAGVQSMDELLEYFRLLLARQSTGSTDSLLRGFLLAEENGSHLSEEELLANSALLLVAGHETTTHLIGNGMLALLQHPSRLHQLQHDPDLMPAAVEELLRYDSPIQVLLRRAKTDLVLAGRKITEGQAILLVCGAANRDPAAFANPHELDFFRSGKRHIAFGHGPHFCLGAGLGRLQGELAIRALITSLPDLRLAQDRLEWDRSLHSRGLKRLDVSFTPQPAAPW
jgi:cytochrome P450